MQTTDIQKSDLFVIAPKGRSEAMGVGVDDTYTDFSLE